MRLNAGDKLVNTVMKVSQHTTPECRLCFPRVFVMAVVGMEEVSNARSGHDLRVPLVACYARLT